MRAVGGIWQRLGAFVPNTQYIDPCQLKSNSRQTHTKTTIVPHGSPTVKQLLPAYHTRNELNQTVEKAGNKKDNKSEKKSR